MESLPTYLRPDPAAPHRLLITVHGIRTFGLWQEKLEHKLREELGRAVEVCHYRYGFFTVLAFLIPPFRWLATRRFRSELLQQANRKRWSRIDIVAHSFGTHLVGYSLLQLPKLQRPAIHTVIFAGSVLKSSFPIRDLVGGCVTQLVNDCGIKDDVLLLNQIFVLFTGMAGRVGLSGMEGGSFRNRYFNFGHGGYFQDSLPGKPDFMSEYWLPLLRSDGVILPHDERTPNRLYDFTTVLLNNAEPIKLACYVLPLILLLNYVNNLRLDAKQEAAVALARQLAAQSEVLQTQYGYLLERSVLLATESLRRSAGLEGDQALRRGLALLPRTLLKTSDGEDRHAIAISPEGNQFAIASNEALWIYEVSTGRPTLAAKTSSSVESMSFARDGAFLVTLDSEGTAEVWKPQGDRAVMEIKGACVSRDLAESARCRAIAVSPNRPWAAIAGSDGSIRVWNLESGQELASFKQRGIVTAIAFSPDGRYVASAFDHSPGWPQEDAGPSDIEVWEAGTGRHLANVRTPAVVVDIVVGNDGNTLTTATTGFGGMGGPERTYTVQAWSRSGTRLASDPGLDRRFNCSNIALDPDGELLAGSTEDGAVRVWTIVSQSEIARLPGAPFSQGGVRAIQFSTDGKRLATLLISSAAVFELGENALTLRLANGETVTGLAFDNKGAHAATTDKSETIRVWDLNRHKVVWEKQVGSVGSPAFSPDGRYVAAVREPAGISIWDASAGQLIAQMKAGKSFVFSTDGIHLASDGSDHWVRLWELPAGKQVAGLEYGDGAYGVWLSGSGRYVATEDEEHTAHVWDMQTGQQLSRIRHPGRVTAGSFSPDGRYLATASSSDLNDPGSAVRVRRIFDGQEISRIYQADKVRDLAFSPDGKLLATASDDAAIWEVNTGRELARLSYERSGYFMEPGVSSVVFSPDGKYIATADAMHTRVWQTATGQEVARIAVNGLKVRFSPDGRYILVDSNALLWRPDDLVAEACSRLTRNLTREEWRQYLGSPPYRKTCLNLP